ncbi:hypothetical protein [Acetobacter sp. DsW_059]|uniref:hypothetical protein n=1 Tax=Acetobacter sp. DsW_059 TaxID=1670661 RepID=UPI000A3BF7E2|nr:hypothetical protein [Acetobacter sp. DsW_059]OUJ10672.1 hypothetical protein HK25_05395 [Acetobacter sp. DsW_059]
MGKKSEKIRLEKLKSLKKDAEKELKYIKDNSTEDTFKKISSYFKNQDNSDEIQKLVSEELFEDIISYLFLLKEIEIAHDKDYYDFMFPDK